MNMDFIWIMGTLIMLPVIIWIILGDEIREMFRNID